MARLCISIPVHEQLPVVFDQIENIRAFTPADTLIVIHPAYGFLDNAWLQSVMPEGVYVNPTSVVNDWGFEEANHGTVIPQHQSNFRFMTGVVKEPFDYFLLEASNDLFFMAGVGDYISHSHADAGIQANPIVPHTNVGNLFEMAAHFGVEVRNSQVEGQFYRTDVYAELMAKVDSQWSASSRMIAAEEWWYPTIVQTITDNVVTPYVYAETHWHTTKHRPTTGLIDSLRHRTYQEDLYQDLVAQSPESKLSFVPSKEYDFDNVYAVKRVARIYDDLLRTYIRGLARQHSARLSLRKPADFRAFNVAVTIEQVFADSRVLSNFARQFTGQDDVALIIVIPEAASAMLSQLEIAVKEVGLDQDGAANVVAYVRPFDSNEESYLSRVVDAIVTVQPLGGVWNEVIQVQPVHTERLRLLADRSIGKRVNLGGSS
jgi:hypothetical protein